MPMSFPGYFIKSTLESFGWPRKRSFFGRRGVVGSLLCSVWSQMEQASVCLGAGKPFRACQLITEMFSSRDWESMSGDALFLEANPAIIEKINKYKELLPWKAIINDEMQVIYGSFINWNDLFGGTIGQYWLMHCSLGLLYGLAHPAEVNQALEKDREMYKSTAEIIKEIDTNFPSQPAWSDNESYFSWVDEVLIAYETDNGLLPQPVPQLLVAKVVRARLY